MRNEIQVFTNEKFGNVRTTVIDGKPWFVGRDVATALGYSNPRDALLKHVDSDDKGVSQIATPSGEQAMTVINESGLYSLILSSKLPTAKQFKRWVTHDVIPAIRQHGAYFTDAALLRLLSDPTQAHMFKEAADVKTADQLHLPAPEVRFETVVVKPSEHQKAMVAELPERAAAVHSGMVDPSQDNIIISVMQNEEIHIYRRKRRTPEI